MAAVAKCLILVSLLFNVCYCSSPVTELLQTVGLLNDCSRFYPHTDRRDVAVDYSAHRLVDLLDRGAQANAERIRPLESLVRQIKYLLLRWEMFALRAVSCTSVLPLGLCQLYQLLMEEWVIQPMKYHRGVLGNRM